MTTPVCTREFAGYEFTSYVRAKGPALLRTARSLTPNPNDAEDLLQTALTKTYLRWGRLRDVQAGEAYVRRVMATTYSSWWRRRWNDEQPTDVPPEETAPDAYGAADDRDVLRRALAGLSKRQRAMVVMRFYGDLSETETAEAMGVSVGTVKSTVARALARLRETSPPSLFSRPTVVRLDEPVTQRTATP
jgi:RNA polymerase sigma-70 factor (sigma-E family)